MSHRLAVEEVEQLSVALECGPRGLVGCCRTGRSRPASRDEAGGHT